jgi:ribosome recycling factor
MDAAVIALSRELSKLRTGRANPGIIVFLVLPCCCYYSVVLQAVCPTNNEQSACCSAGMLDHIMVETADVKVALNRIAVVSVLDAHTLSVMPYDPSVIASFSFNMRT